jgi:hypothetical protein
MYTLIKRQQRLAIQLHLRISFQLASVSSVD